jgi:hypothetical protein
VFLDEGSRFDPPVKKFLGKEGVAFTLRVEERTDRWTERTERAERTAEQVKGKCFNLLEGEWLDGDGREYASLGEFSDGVGEGGVAIQFTIAVSAYDEQMGMRLAACQVTQQIQAGCIRPVQIIEKENEHMGEANGLQEGSNRFIEAKACLLRR